MELTENTRTIGFDLAQRVQSVPETDEQICRKLLIPMLLRSYSTDDMRLYPNREHSCDNHHHVKAFDALEAWRKSSQAMQGTNLRRLSVTITRATWKARLKSLFNRLRCYGGLVDGLLLLSLVFYCMVGALIFQLVERPAEQSRMEQEDAQIQLDVQEHARQVCMRELCISNILHCMGRHMNGFSICVSSGCRLYVALVAGSKYRISSNLTP